MEGGVLPPSPSGTGECESEASFSLTMGLPYGTDGHCLEVGVGGGGGLMFLVWDSYWRRLAFACFRGGAGGKDVWVWIVRGTVDCLRTLPGLWIDEKPDSPGSRFDERSERG